VEHPRERVERVLALGAVNPRLPAGIVEQQWGSWPLRTFLLLGSGHTTCSTSARRRP